MSLSQTAPVKAAPRRSARFGPFRFLKRFMPRGLFGRSLIIIVAPVVILQGILAYVFFERDVDVATRRIARDVAADVAFLVALEDSYGPAQRADLLSLAARMLRYEVAFQPGATIAAPHRHRISTIDEALDDVIAQQIGAKRHFETRGVGQEIEIRVEVHDGVLRMVVPRDRITVSSPDIFILLMVGSSLGLLAVAILFLRNQVRPIERLARAADSFGKGRPVRDYKPYGAVEVRRAAEAFITMKERIERHVQQRTEMLAGVSHDLKTPLTRIKLELAMMGGAEAQALRTDVAEMERMLDEYLEFARGEEGEKAHAADLGTIIGEAGLAAARARGADAARLSVDARAGLLLTVKAHALKRCVTNLIDNALKYGAHVAVSLSRDAGFAQIHVDDDGPGIAEARREEAFRPFHRLDEGRNLQTGGVGLGLAIARDIARAHGGDLLLSQSPLGGLRATVQIPV